MSDDQRLLEAFDDCLNYLKSGESLADCLRRYPDLAADLRPMLTATLAALAASRVSRSAQMRSRSQFLTAAGERRPKVLVAWWRWLSPVFALGATLAIVWLAFAVASTTVLNRQTPTPSPTLTASPTITPSNTVVQSSTVTPSPTATSSPTVTATPMASATIAPTLTTVTPTDTAVPPSPTVTPNPPTSTEVTPTPQPPGPTPTPNPDSTPGTTEPGDDNSNDNSGGGGSGRSGGGGGDD